MEGEKWNTQVEARKRTIVQTEVCGAFARIQHLLTREEAEGVESAGRGRGKLVGSYCSRMRGAPVVHRDEHDRLAKLDGVRDDGKTGIGRRAAELPRWTRVSLMR